MGNARFLTDNLITSESMLTVSSERAGQVGLAVKVGSGSATLSPGGPYTGANPRQYIVEVNDVSAGAGVGSATYRWRPSDVSAWSATGVSTSAAPTVLESGITVAWVSGGGTDFVAGDYWTITVDKPFGKAKLLDRDRDTEWRSTDAGTATAITVDLGSPKTIDALALLDTNLRSAYQIGLCASDSLGTLYSGSPYFSSIFPGENVVFFTTGSPTYRYWGVVVYETGNPDGYLRIGSLYLGPYTEFSGNFDRGWARSRNAALYGPTGALRTPRGVWATAETLYLQYRLMTTADRTKVLAMFDTLYSPTIGTVRPILFNLDSADAADVSLYELDTPELPVSSQFVGLYEWSLRLRQRPRIARSGS